MKKEILYLLKACFSLFRIKTAEGISYRIAGLAGATTSIFWALIEITVYTIFFHFAKNSSRPTSLTLQQTITYTWLAQFLFLMQPMGLDSEILSQINNGDVGIELCRPLDLYFHWFTKTAAGRIVPLMWRGLAVLAAGLLLPGNLNMSPPCSFAGLFLMLVSSFSALWVCTSYGMLACAIRLNTSWGNGPMYMLLLAGGVLSGSYLPLQLWPDSLQHFLLFQPFSSYLDIPIRFYIGTLKPAQALLPLGLQILWTLLFIALGRFLMANRLRKIVIQGG